MKWLSALVVWSTVQVSMAGAAYVDFELKKAFPDSVGSLQCSAVDKFNEAHGYSIHYTNVDFRAEVTVYDLAREKIGNGHNAAGVADEIAAVGERLDKQEDAGAILDWRKKGSAIFPDRGDVRFANTVFQVETQKEVDGKAKPVKRIQSVYMTGADNKFYKVVLEFDLPKGKEARTVAQDVIKMMIGVIKTEPMSDEALLLASCETLLYSPVSYEGTAAAQFILMQLPNYRNIAIYDALFAWGEGYQKPKNADLLKTAYFAGMLKTILPQNLDSGGEFEAFSAMLDAYTLMREKSQISSIPKFDEWSGIEDRKAAYKQALIDCEYIAPE